MRKFIPLVVLFLSPLAMAKIGDCPTIKDNGVIYQSHADYIEATEDKTQKMLWHTELLERDHVYNPFLETDVQWNIMCLNAVTKDRVIAIDNRNRRFELDKKTGELRKVYDYQVTFNSSIDNEFDGITSNYGDYYVKKSLDQFKLTGDYAMLTKQIDYVNDSLIIVFANKKSPITSYDIALSLPNDKTYILNNVAKEKIGQLFSDFASHKPIDTKNWQMINTENLEEWYEQNYHKQREIDAKANENHQP